MEESVASHDLSLSMSNWKLKQQGLKNQRNHRQLQNRLLILELQRQSKVKSIEKKLQSHKKLMQIKMDRLKLKQSLQKHDKDIEGETNVNSKIFKEVRVNRSNNIRSRSSQMRQTNHRLFREIKRQRQHHQHVIKKESFQELSTKTEKRNRVRMIEIQSKENIGKFWRKKMDYFKENREKEIAKNMSMEEKKMGYLLHLQKNQANLLSEIKRTEEMESQLLTMMAEERSMLHATAKS